MEVGYNPRRSVLECLEVNRVRIVRVGPVSQVEGPQQEPLESTTGIEVIVSLKKRARTRSCNSGGVLSQSNVNARSRVACTDKMLLVA